MRARPLLAINTTIYWHALREFGITDRIAGFGPLLARYRFFRSAAFRRRDAASARNVLSCRMHASTHAPLEHVAAAAAA